MTDADGTAVGASNLLEILKSLAWCKQGENILVAVHKCTPEIIEIMKDHEVKVFPSGMTVRIAKSLIHTFQEAFDEGQPLPVVVVWKPEGVEIWYRRNKSNDFPYDIWTGQPGAPTETERAFVPAQEFEDHDAQHKEALGKAKECPTMIPQY